MAATDIFFYHSGIQAIVFRTPDGQWAGATLKAIRAAGWTADEIGCARSLPRADVSLLVRSR